MVFCQRFFCLIWTVFCLIQCRITQMLGPKHLQVSVSNFPNIKCIYKKVVQEPKQLTMLFLFKKIAKQHKQKLMRFTQEKVNSLNNQVILFQGHMTKKFE